MLGGSQDFIQFIWKTKSDRNGSAGWRWWCEGAIKGETQKEEDFNERPKGMTTLLQYKRKTESHSLLSAI